MFKRTQRQLKRRSLSLITCLGSFYFFDAFVFRGTADCPPQWIQIGPAPLIINPPDGANGMGPDAGLVRDIAIDPRGTTDQTIYVATDNGGIWKTTDGGNTWAPKTDMMPSLNMGSVALDPGNPSIVYAGTGNEYNQGFFNGVGIYKSVDGGNTWAILGGTIFANVAVNRILLTAPNALMVASGTGVYRSIDGGANFGNNTPLFNNGSPIRGGDVTDLDVDTASPTTVYASIFSAGIFKSTDSGATFPASGNLFTATNGAPTSFGFLRIAQSTVPNASTIYANIALYSDPANAGMFKSTNSGATWTRISLSTGDNESVPRGYIQTIGVDPQDANRAYVGFRALYMVTDGGASGVTASNRIDLNKVHADQHAFIFTPPSHRTGPAPTRFYTGTDGGLSTNPDGGINNWTLLNGSATGVGAFATMLFRQIDIGRGSTANNVYTYGGSQDLGVASRTPANAGMSWRLGVGGDGWSVAVDPNDPRHAHAMAGNFQTTVDGISWQAGGTGVPSTAQPIYYDPNGGIVYALVNNQLLRSTNNGGSFSVMRTFNAALTEINMVKSDSNTIWLAANDGVVWHTSTANNGTGAVWVIASVTGAPSQVPTGIAIDPTNTSQVVVIYPAGQAFLTADNGATWANITGNLPPLQLNAVVIDPNTTPHTIIVANNATVMKTTDSGVRWEALGGGLPTVSCTSLAIDSTAVPSLLRVGTYGRSAFELAYDRQYVDRQNFGAQDGTRELPFRTVLQARDAAPTGASKFINIKAGIYPESPITFDQCMTLNALNGAVTIQ